MVITRTTRNRFAFTGTWVRIPPSPFAKREIADIHNDGGPQFLCTRNVSIDINPSIELSLKGKEYTEAVDRFRQPPPELPRLAGG